MPVRISIAMAREGARYPAHRLARLRSLVALSGLLGLAMVASGGSNVSASPNVVQSTAPFTFNFTGDPKAPQPWNPTTWDVIVHSEDPRTFSQLDSMQAQHGADCSPYPATHINNTYEGAVFLCHNHVMTAINAHGYGEIVLTPDHMVDFSGGDTTISFDLSTMRTSTRDWVDFWITPFDNNLVLPLDERVDLQGPPARGIHVRMQQTSVNGTIFAAELIDNFQVTKLPYIGRMTLEKLITPSAVKRTQFALTISPTHIKFGAPELGYNWVDTSIGKLAWTRGVVQLSHHSYNPTKHCTPSPVLACVPDTWHWSNFYISNAVPFTLLRGDPQVVHGAAGTVTFPGPAPKSAFVRFAAIGSIDISLDGGKTWQPATKQAQSRNVVAHFSSYWMPVATGTTSVSLRGHDWQGHPWWIRDVSIWSTASSTSSAPAKPGTAPAAAPRASALQVLLAAWRSPAPVAIGVILLVALGSVGYVLIRRRRSPPGRS
jgi:hypothetical protein